MEPITYSLLSEDINSDLYYKDISVFTDIILNESNEVRDIVKDYMTFLEKQKLESLRSNEEYIYEALSLGVYSILYSYPAKHASIVWIQICRLMCLFRKKIKVFKTPIDFFRGLLGAKFLLNIRNIFTPAWISSIKEFSRLNNWLNAAGEFNEECRRFFLWIKYLKSLPKENFTDISKIINRFALKFFDLGHEYLEKYTPNVDFYAKCKLNDKKYDEDYIFCGRYKEEYYLSMVGAEIMNRAFKKNFINSEVKAVLLPACMRSKSEKDCKAKKISLDFICSSCDVSCNVNRIVKLGKRYNFIVRIIPHSSNFSAWLKKFAYKQDIGVIGVACPLNLISGGLELKALDIPAQCVLLDYCGCKNHWNEAGLSTQLNESILLNYITAN